MHLPRKGNDTAKHTLSLSFFFDLARKNSHEFFQSQHVRACAVLSACVVNRRCRLSKRANSDNSNGMTEVLNPSRTRSRMYVILLVWTTHAFERVVCDEAGLVWNERARQRKSPFCSSKRTCRTVGRPPRRFKSTGLFCQRGTGVCDLLSQLVRSVGDRPEGRRIVE